MSVYFSKSSSIIIPVGECMWRFSLPMYSFPHINCILLFLPSSRAETRSEKMGNCKFLKNLTTARIILLKLKMQMQGYKGSYVAVFQNKVTLTVDPLTEDYYWLLEDVTITVNDLCLSSGLCFAPEEKDWMCHSIFCGGGIKDRKRKQKRQMCHILCLYTVGVDDPFSIRCPWFT